MASVLITGCSSGIGRATAQLLASRGYRVIATARRIETLADLDVAQRLSLDVTDAESVARAAQAAGEVDVLVNNAGIGMWAPLETVPLEAAERVIETNLLGALRMTQALVPGMRARGRGRVLMVSSAAATRVSPLLGMYCASKAALEAVARALRFELREFGVQVVVVSMLGVDSEFGRNRYMAAEQGSPYADLIARSKLRLEASRAQPAAIEQVAEAIAAAIELPDPPFRVYVGEGTRDAVERVARMADDDYERMISNSLWPEKEP